MTRIVATFVRLLQWTIFTLGLAAIAHIGIVVYTPSLIMSRLMGQIAKTPGVNKMIHPSLPTHESRTVVRPSPNLLYSICHYNLTNGPIRITAAIPPDRYWSLSIYGDNSDNYFVINDQQAGGKNVDMILAGTGSRLENPDRLPVIEAATFSGVILTRTLVPADADLDALDRIRRNSSCDDYVAPPPTADEEPVAP